MGNCAQLPRLLRPTRPLLPRVRPEPGTLQRGRSGLRALALPARKMATLGRRGKERESGQLCVGLSSKTRGRRREARPWRELAAAWTLV